MYEYNATVLANVDGDTIHARVDLGMDCHMDVKLRLAGINAPEIATPEGQKVAAYVAQLLPPGTTMVIRTVKDRKEKYGRYLAWIMLGKPVHCLNADLVEQGMAIPYGGLSLNPPSV